jgi:hypothetical protein
MPASRRSPADEGVQIPSGAKTRFGLDLYNLFGRNTRTAYNATYDPVTNGATWLRPTTLNPRFVRFKTAVDF